MGLGGKRRQHRVKGMTVGKQRMQHNQIGTFARADRGKRAAPSAQLLHLHPGAPWYSVSLTIAPYKPTAARCRQRSRDSE